MDNTESKIAETINNTIRSVEEHVTSTIEKLDNLNVDDFETLRAQRLKQLKKEREQQIEWKKLGHGTYQELGETVEFFNACKSSENVVCHFYSRSSPVCKIIDMHLKQLSVKHLETRFVYVDVERVRFLADRLNIKVTPAIFCFKNNYKVDKFTGLTPFGNREDFETVLLEWHLAKADVIKSDLDLTAPPEHHSKKKRPYVYSSIRNGSHHSSRNETDIEAFIHSDSGVDLWQHKSGDSDADDELDDTESN